MSIFHQIIVALAVATLYATAIILILKYNKKDKGWDQTSCVRNSVMVYEAKRGYWRDLDIYCLTDKDHKKLEAETK